jgi:HlyD family secretion protein
VTSGLTVPEAVEPGQMIAQIDPRLYKATVDQAEANLAAARANVHKMKAQLDDAARQARRLRTLGAEKLVAEQDTDTAITNESVARAQLEAAQAAEAQARAVLETARLNLEYTRIVSPIRGTVITRNVDVGQTVAASFAAPTLFVIGEDLTKMEVDTSIAEGDVGRLQPGMSATFTVDAYPAEVFTGTIRDVRSSPQIVQNVVTYNAVVDVANPDRKLKPGMTANLDIVHADRKDVLRVPNAALRFHAPPDMAGKSPLSAPPGRRVVWVMRAGTPVALVITPGVSDGTVTEVLAGDLAPGDELIVEATPTHPASSVGRML